MKENKEKKHDNTSALIFRSDVNTVHFNMDFIFYVYTQLIIIVKELTAGPQVKPVVLPSL